MNAPKLTPEQKALAEDLGKFVSAKNYQTMKDAISIASDPAVSTHVAMQALAGAFATACACVDVQMGRVPPRGAVFSTTVEGVLKTMMAILTHGPEGAEQHEGETK